MERLGFRAKIASLPIATAVAPLLAVLILGVIWQIFAPMLNVPDYVLPVPTKIIERFIETYPSQLYHLGATALTTITGLIIALVAGIALAFAVVYLPLLGTAIMPLFAAFNSIPKIAIAPLFVVWFGLGLEPKMMLAFLLAVFPIFVNSMTGLSEIEPDYIDLAKLSGGNSTRVFRLIRIMNALPYVFDALKIALPLALTGSIVGEFIGGNRGSGYLILSGQLNLDTPLVFATLLSVSLFATVGIVLIGIIERWMIWWQPSQRGR